jgi:hypothetical protein
MDNKHWNQHPEIKNIIKFANYIDKKIDEDKVWKLSDYENTIFIICDYYKNLIEQNFIDSLPFYGPSPKGLRSGVNIVLPKYAIADYLIGGIQIQISNLFNNGNSPEVSLKRDDKNISHIKNILEKLRATFNSHSEFQKFLFMKQNTDLSIKQLVENDFSYESICKVFGNSSV